MRTRTSTRALAALTAAAVLSVIGASAASADDISNNLDASVDAAAEVMPLNVGGTTGTTTLRVITQNGDGKSGCNLTGGTSLTLAISSSNAAVATVSPSSVTFTSCSDTKTLTVTPVAQGSATVRATQTNNTTEGTFNLAPASFTANVAPPANTAPTISVAGVSSGASYDKGSVPAATCRVTDAEDGDSSFAATLSAVTGSYAADGLGSRTASCSYTDGGGLTASSSATYSIVDPSAPVITKVLSPASPDGLNGWYKNSVSLTWTVTETESPNSLVKTGCVDQTINVDQAATDYSCSATSAGGSANEQTVSLKRDSAGPTVTAGAPTGTAGLAGWFTSNVTVDFTATDTLSGPASTTATVTSSGQGNAVTINSPVFSDAAGNTTPAGTASRTVMVDLDGPTVTAGTPTGTTGANGWYLSNVTVPFTAVDAVSGPAAATAEVTSSGSGSDVPVASPAFSDVAGNTTAAGAVSRSYKIDLNDPTVTWAPFSTLVYSANVPAAPTCIANDVTSGPVGCDVTGYSTAVGTHTLTATATDFAGRTATKTHTYTVQQSLTSKGFYQPIDMGANVTNTVKGGSTVPVKFELFADGVEKRDTTDVTVSTRKVTCSSGLVSDEIETLATTGATALRYDATGDQFITNWKTPTGAGCYLLTMTAADVTVTANFKTR